MTEASPLAASLLQRCDSLLSSIASFEGFLSERRLPSVEVKPLKNSLRSERKSLEKISNTDLNSDKTQHNLRSSNLPFYEAVWETARSSEGLVALQKCIPWVERRKQPGSSNKKQHQHQKTNNKPAKKKRTLVDVVAKEGLEWIKVSTVSETTLLFEKAKAGWEEGGGDSDDDKQENCDGSATAVNGNNGKNSKVRKIYPEGVEPPTHASDSGSDGDSEDEYGRVELVRMAQDLKKAAGMTRVQYEHPKVVIVLPNIKEGSSNVVDGILRDLRNTGAKVLCGPTQSPTSLADQTCFTRMATSPTPSLTPAINLDCTVLLALISDLSHMKPSEVVLPERPHPSLLHQVEVEKTTPLLPQILYPGLLRGGGIERLVTSKRSATRMWEIVRTIGTATERARAEILFGVDADVDADESSTINPTDQDNHLPSTNFANTDSTLTSRLQTLSIHPTPPGLPLPIAVIDGGIQRHTSAAPGPVLAAVSTQLSEINRSVFMLGWTNGWSTVTSNRVAARLIENCLTRELDRMEDERDEVVDKNGDECGGENGDGGAEGSGDHDVNGGGRKDVHVIEPPRIWTIDVARSLVGKRIGQADY